MTKRLSSLMMFAGAVLAGLVLAPSRASAYPQWQFSADSVRCNQCHFSPAGGGLITGYGRDKNGEELSLIEGDGSFLHGAVELPSWLAIGADLRGAVISRDDSDLEGTKRAFFPMQADLHTRIAPTDSLSLQFSVGYRGQVRDAVSDTDLGYLPAGGSRFISREHFVMWRPKPTGLYVRAGRFYAPFGLRLAEHITYIRRDTGFNLLQESYNLSAGYLDDEWEAHLTFFGPDFLRDMGSKDKGVAVYAEKRFAEIGGVGVQSRVSIGDTMNRFIVGGVGKVWIAPARLMVLAEGNLDIQTFSAADRQMGFIGAGGVAVLPYKGIMLTLLGERKQTALSALNSATNAGTALLSIFPYPHVELQVMGRTQMPAGQPSDKTLLVQLHYWL